MIFLFTKGEVNMTVSSCQSSTCEKENDFSVNISKESETFMDEISRYKYLEKRVVDLTRHNKVLCDKVSNVIFL